MEINYPEKVLCDKTVITTKQNKYPQNLPFDYFMSGSY